MRAFVVEQKKPRKWDEQSILTCQGSPTVRSRPETRHTGIVTVNVKRPRSPKS